MCGITGSIGIHIPQEEKVLCAIAHRGPDSEGFFKEGDVFLGHTRLSIQDLSENGNQPMYSVDGRYVIIFNGEVYNHPEVRAQFENEFAFRSTGDTEVVLNAYIKYGAACLNMLNGIFAFAIYDRKSEEIFIARDQMGVKPLYVYTDKKGLLFSSEIKTMLNYNINKTLEPKAFANYLTFLWSPGTVTPYAYINKLLPGYYIKSKVSDITNAVPVRYYNKAFTGKYSSATEEELIDQLDIYLVNAVKRQMLSDVPVGFFLSGGLDSSLVVAIAKKLFPENRFQCFTIDGNGWEMKYDNFTDDLAYAKKVAEYLDVELNIVKADIDIVKDFDKMIWYLDEPQADAAPLNVLNIAALARDMDIRVLLGGAAGDDLFSGYRRHQALRYEKYFRKFPSPLRKLVKAVSDILPAANPAMRRMKKVIGNIDKDTDRRMADYFSWLPDKSMRSLFTKEWQQKLKNYTPSSQLLALDKDIPAEKNLLNRMLYWEMKSFLVDHNLNYTDKMAMAVGVEARVPFLDLDLVAFSMELPPELKMKNGETKYILKKVAERYLPHDVIYRPKTGFGAPVRKWIVEDLDDMIKERLSAKRLNKMGIFDPEAVAKLVRDNKSGKIDASYSIWSLLAINSWIEQFYIQKHVGE